VRGVFWQSHAGTSIASLARHLSPSRAGTPSC
jgi:hypothetical protein